jgi:hypothetical protein
MANGTHMKLPSDNVQDILRKTEANLWRSVTVPTGR